MSKEIEQAKLAFIDRPKIRKAVLEAFGPGPASVLVQFAAFVRRSAKSSIRKRKRCSLPGQPPSSHKGLLRDFILFAWDEATRTIVIGPRKLSGMMSDTALHALEFGGPSMVYRGRGRKEVLLIAPRPYMYPAMERELPKFPAMLRDCVRLAV